jgi:hypothetical protein
MMPFASVFARFAFAMRRALADAPRAAERITSADVFHAEVSALSAGRLRLQIAALALLAFASGSHVVEGLADGTLSSKGIWLFCLFLSVYLSTHYGLLLLAKRALRI